jgi:hypothetical protein
MMVFYRNKQGNKRRSRNQRYDWLPVIFPQWRNKRDDIVQSLFDLAGAVFFIEPDFCFIPPGMFIRTAFRAFFIACDGDSAAFRANVYIGYTLVVHL